MTDFSQSLMHCSTIAYFMAPGKGKTPMQLWADATDDLEEQICKYNALDDRKRNMKTGANMLAKIHEMEQKVADLALNRHIEPLSETAKTFLKKYYFYLKYGKWSAAMDKGNKYTNKGKLAEPESIKLCGFLDDRPLEKNTDRFSNIFITGEPDVIWEGKELYIYDVKTSWDIETFGDVLGKDLNPLYWWQIQGYFALTGAKSGEVSYCLVDTPATIMEQEKYRLASRMDAATSLNPEYMEAEADLINNMTFEDIPPQERRIRFTVERDDEAIERIYQRVPLCRAYLAEIEQLHLQGTFAAKSKKEEESSLELAQCV